MTTAIKLRAVDLSGGTKEIVGRRTATVFRRIRVIPMTILPARRSTLMCRTTRCDIGKARGNGRAFGPFNNFNLGSLIQPIGQGLRVLRWHMLHDQNRGPKIPGECRQYLAQRTGPPVEVPMTTASQRAMVASAPPGERRIAACSIRAPHWSWRLPVHGAERVSAERRRSFP